MPSAYMSSHLSANRRALTLIEAVVVLVIICLLIAILLPARSHGGPAKISASASNMKQITLACAMYATDFHQELPPNLSTLFTTGLLVDARVLFDPRTHTGSYKPLPITPQLESLSEYIYAGADLNLAKLSYPESTIILYDKCAKLPGRNIAFADGHIEYIVGTSRDLQTRIKITNTARAAQHLLPLPPDLLSAPQPTTLPSKEPQ